MYATGLPFEPVPAKTSLTVAFGFVLPLEPPQVNDEVPVVAIAAAFRASGLLAEIVVDEDERLPTERELFSSSITSKLVPS